jgi:hypothetical protein
VKNYLSLDVTPTGDMEVDGLRPPPRDAITSDFRGKQDDDVESTCDLLGYGIYSGGPVYLDPGSKDLSVVTEVPVEPLSRACRSYMLFK